MNRAVSTLLSGLLLSTLALPATAGRQGHELVHYDFDERTVDTGPYTLMVFEHSAGTVQLSEAYRYSGRRSVEIRDVAGDGEFAELQGYFPDRATGTLFVHFALMTAAPLERFNVAFAGPAHFFMEKDGLGIWLKADDGVLYQVSDGQDLALFELRAFTWYRFDLAYHVDAGLYDLTVYEEDAAEPFLARQGQPNAVGEPESLIHKFSFIGDVPWLDGSDAHFFVDDIVVRSDRPLRQSSFVAPGRRMLFVDLWDHYRRQTYKSPGCPPVLGYEDFGLTPRDLQELSRAGALALVDAILEGASPEPRERPFDPSEVQSTVEGLTAWRDGCRQRRACDAACRLAALERAEAALPGGKLPSMCRLMALAAAGRWVEADELFVEIYPDWRHDPRFPAIAGVLGMARDRLDEAERELLRLPESLHFDGGEPALRRLWSGRLGPGLVDELESALGADWSRHVASALAADHRFYVLLWKRRDQEALAYAERMIAHFRELELPAGVWLERRGDAAFRAGLDVEALESYRAALGEVDNPTPVLLKLSDVHFRMGDLDAERSYREKIYGSLAPKWSQHDPEPGLPFDRCKLCPSE